MKIPRDVSSLKLIKELHKFGYSITRQSGSHIRITTQQNGEHHITIPNHDPIKIGTLNAILTDIADHLKINKSELINKIF